MSRKSATGISALRALSSLLLIVLLAGSFAACSSDDGSDDAERFSQKLDEICTKQAAYSLWLPAKVADEDLNGPEAEQALESAIDEDDATLESLDPPKDMAQTYEELTDLVDDFATATTPNEVTPLISTSAELYRQLGAEKCATHAEVSIALIDGASPEDAYEDAGLDMPERPDGF